MRPSHLRTLPLVTVFLALLGLYQALFSHLYVGDGLTGGLFLAFALILLSFCRRPFLSGGARQLLCASARTIGALALLAVASLGLQSTFFHNVLAGQGGLFGQSLSQGANDGLLNASGTVALMSLALCLLAFGAFGALLEVFREEACRDRRERPHG